MMFRQGYKAAVLAIVAASFASSSDAFNLKCESMFSQKIHIMMFLRILKRAAFLGLEVPP